ncbi:MAG: OmpP1/FadL family transporter [Myxococcota bacterium]
MLLAALASPALASAYYFLDSGTRAIGRGGAFIAGADDLSAQYYNPAALAHVERPMLQFQGWAANQYVLFDRADEEECGRTDEDGNPDCAFAPVENESPPIYEPNLGFATPLGGVHPLLKNTTVAIGMYTPTSPYLAFPEDGPQRYALIDSLIWQIYAGPSVAQRVTPWLTLGAGLQYTFLRVEERLVATACFYEEACEEGSDDPANDIQLDLKTWDTMQWSGNAGILVQPTKWLDIGFSVQPPIKYEAPGSLEATFDEELGGGVFADQLASLSTKDEDVLLLVTVPLILRGGVQVKPVETVRVEVAGTWTGWGALEELRITDVDMVVKDNPDEALLEEDLLITDDVVFATGYQDAWSARLGGDWQIKDFVRASAGVHYESSAVPPQTQAVNLVDGPKWGFGLGAGVTIAKRVTLDASFAKQFIQSRSITDSDFRQQALFTDAANDYESSVLQGKVVGNGDFASNLTFVGIGATLYFGGTEAASE